MLVLTRWEDDGARDESDADDDNSNIIDIAVFYNRSYGTDTTIVSRARWV